MKVENKNQSIELNVLGYEYPPGWGAGMPYDTDWLDVRINLKDGDKTREIEDTFIRFSELDQVFENVNQILEGMQSDYYSDFMDKRFSMAVYVIEDRDIFLEMAYLDEDSDLSIKQELTSEDFRNFVMKLEEDLVSNYRSGE